MFLFKKCSKSSRPNFLSVGLVWPLLGCVHPLRMQQALGSIPSVSMHGMLHVSWLEKDFFRPPATSTDSVSAVLFVGLVSCLSVPLFAQGPGGQYTLENAGRDDLGGFSTPILLRCSCSKKCSKSSRPHFLSVGLVWPLLGCVHPLRMQKALGSIPSVSMHSMLHVSWLEKDFFRPPAPSTDSVSAVLFVGLVSCLSVPLFAQGPGGQYTLENAERDDLGGFSTPILLRCSCSKKCSKPSRPHFLSVGLVWPLLGCVHPLRMQKALGSIPSVSMR